MLLIIGIRLFIFALSSLEYPHKLIDEPKLTLLENQTAQRTIFMNIQVYDQVIPYDSAVVMPKFGIKYLGIDGIRDIVTNMAARSNIRVGLTRVSTSNSYL